MKQRGQSSLCIQKTLEQLEVAKEKLSAPELEYQKYLKDKQEWEK